MFLFFFSEESAIDYIFRTYSFAVIVLYITLTTQVDSINKMCTVIIFVYTRIFIFLSIVHITFSFRQSGITVSVNVICYQLSDMMVHKEQLLQHRKNIHASSCDPDLYQFLQFYFSVMLSIKHCMLLGRMNLTHEGRPNICLRKSLIRHSESMQ